MPRSALNTLYFLLAFWLFEPCWAWGQQKKDSLLLLLKTDLTDSARSIVLSELCWEYGFDNKTKAVEYGEQGAALAKKISNAYAEGCAYNLLGSAYLRSGDYD